MKGRHVRLAGRAGGRSLGRFQLTHQLLFAQGIEEGFERVGVELRRRQPQWLPHEAVVCAVERDGHVRLPLVDHLLLGWPAAHGSRTRITLNDPTLNDPTLNDLTQQ